jgi:phenylpyruvate tautomerase PptA (4-oxalocrotonate tautomerase family)
MPMTKIYLRRGASAEHKRAISEALHASLVEVLGIPEDDKYHVFQEFDAENLIAADVAFGLERRGDRAIFVQPYFGPRPVETLNELFSSMVRNITATTDLEPRDIFINVVESPSPNWWAAGRELDPRTGFDVRITEDKVPGAS